MSEQGHPQFDVIAIGDTTEDIFLQMSDASVQCNLDGEQCKICFDYADKIAVDGKTIVSAVGNAANHAIGVSRMGLKSAIYTVVGSDDEGKKTKEIFEENGVDTRYLVFDEERGTNLSVVINYRTERTILVYHEPRVYDLPEFTPPAWIYLTSASGDGVHNMHEQVISYLDTHTDVRMAFNPGTHQMHLGREELLPLLERTDILFLNREEAARVLEIDTLEIDTLVAGYHDIGVKTVVITDGPEGAYVSDGSETYYAGIFDGPVIERTGAGDAYGSGFLSAIMHGKSPQEAMLWGNANSTSVVQYIGAREGLLTPEVADKMIGENPTVIPEPFRS